MTNVHTTVPFGDISIDTYTNVRGADNGDLDVSDLVASIPIVGLLEPLGVHPAVDGRYPLVFGWRRYHALRQLKMPEHHEVPVVILGEPNLDSPEPTQHADLRILQLTENLMRVDLDPVEISNGFYELLQGGMKQKEIAETFNTSSTRVSQLLSLQRLPPDITALVAVYEVSLEVAGQIARLKDPAWIVELWEEKKRDYGSAGVGAVESLAYQVEFLLRRKKQDEARKRYSDEMFKLGFAFMDAYPSGWKYVGQVKAEADEMNAAFTQAMTDEHLHPADSDRLQWYASMRDVENGEVQLLLKPSKAELERRAQKAEADPNYEAAREAQEAAEREKRAVNREIQRLFSEHVATIIAKPPIAKTKSAALAYSTHVHAPQSKKQAVEMLGLEVKLTKDGKKDWDGTYYGYCDEARRAGDEKALCRIFLTMQILNGGLRDFLVAEGVPSEAELRKQVEKERAAPVPSAGVGGGGGGGNPSPSHPLPRADPKISRKIFEALHRVPNARSCACESSWFPSTTSCP